MEGSFSADRETIKANNPIERMTKARRRASTTGSA